MANKESKKVWATPELIILLRSKPEEAVLDTCKTPSVRGPQATNAVCKQGQVACSVERSS
jgi:hypothetical protein